MIRYLLVIVIQKNPFSHSSRPQRAQENKILSYIVLKSCPSELENKDSEQKYISMVKHIEYKASTHYNTRLSYQGKRGTKINL